MNYSRKRFLYANKLSHTHTIHDFYIKTSIQSYFASLRYSHTSAIPYYKGKKKDDGSPIKLF